MNIRQAIAFYLIYLSLYWDKKDRRTPIQKWRATREQLQRELS